MELYQFGFGAQTEPAARPRETAGFSPSPVRHAQAIRVLWSSWCDTVVAHQDAVGSWTLEYMGSGLTSSQRESITQSNELKHAISRNTNSVRFFGGAMHEGLGGYVVSENSREALRDSIVLFATDQELDSGVPGTQCYILDSKYEVVDVQIRSGRDVLVSVRDLSAGEAQILRFLNITQLRQCLTSENALCSTEAPLDQFAPVKWDTNSTTTTALDEQGKVYTATSDPRYPKCLGRPYEASSSFENVPYLSETHVVSIASGGYMSAAISSDGELFLWGQACAGATKELRVLNDKARSEESSHQPLETSICAESEPDELIKCLVVRIDGEEARVYAIAIGHGHIMVAAEVSDPPGGAKKALFVAGDNSRQQLGIAVQDEYLEEFTEVVAFRGKQVEQLAAAGWSSFVVVSA